MGSLPGRSSAPVASCLPALRYCVDAARLASAVDGTVRRDGRLFKVPPGLAPVEITDVWLTGLRKDEARDRARLAGVVAALSGGAA